MIKLFSIVVVLVLMFLSLLVDWLERVMQFQIQGNKPMPQTSHYCIPLGLLVLAAIFLFL